MYEVLLLITEFQYPRVCKTPKSIIHFHTKSKKVLIQISVGHDSMLENVQSVHHIYLYLFLDYNDIIVFILSLFFLPSLSVCTSVSFFVVEV